MFAVPHFHPYSAFVDWEHPVWLRYGKEFGPDIPELDTPWGDQRAIFQVLPHFVAMQSSVCGYVMEEPLSSAPEKRETQIEWALGLETLFQAINAVGDCSLYFMIHRDDLVARRWDRFLWTLQCT